MADTCLINIPKIILIVFETISFETLIRVRKICKLWKLISDDRISSILKGTIVISDQKYPEGSNLYIYADQQLKLNKYIGKCIRDDLPNPVYETKILEIFGRTGNSLYSPLVLKLKLNNQEATLELYAHTVSIDDISGEKIFYSMACSQNQFVLQWIQQKDYVMRKPPRTSYLHSSLYAGGKESLDMLLAAYDFEIFKFVKHITFSYGGYVLHWNSDLLKIGRSVELPKDDEDEPAKYKFVKEASTEIRVAFAKLIIPFLKKQGVDITVFGKIH